MVVFSYFWDQLLIKLQQTIYIKIQLNVIYKTAPIFLRNDF